MEIYFIRHGIAAERAEYTQDEIRPLTEQGKEKTIKVAQRLQRIGLNFDLMLTSPLVRARTTAEILQKAGLTKQILEYPPLAPGGDFDSWVSWLLNSEYNQRQSNLALVGHQPDLGNWAEMLVWGSAQEKLELKKAGVIGLELPENGSPVGNSILFLLTSPKWLL